MAHQSRRRRVLHLLHRHQLERHHPAPLPATFSCSKGPPQSATIPKVTLAISSPAKWNHQTYLRHSSTLGQSHTSWRCHRGIVGALKQSESYGIAMSIPHGFHFRSRDASRNSTPSQYLPQRQRCSQTTQPTDGHYSSTSGFYILKSLRGRTKCELNTTLITSESAATTPP